MPRQLLKLTALFSLFLFASSPAIPQEKKAKIEVTKTKTVLQFFRDNTNFRVSKGAAESYKDTLNEMSLPVIKKAEKNAQKDKRKTILDRDVDQAAEEVFRQAPISVKELMGKVRLLSVIDLSDFSNQVLLYNEELLEKAKKK